MKWSGVCIPLRMDSNIWHCFGDGLRQRQGERVGLRHRDLHCPALLLFGDRDPEIRLLLGAALVVHHDPVMPLQAELRLCLPVNNLQQPAPVWNVPDAVLDDVVARADDIVDGVHHRLLNLWIQQDCRRLREIV